MAGLDPKDTRVTWKFIGNMDGSSNDHTSEFLFAIMIPSLAVILTISGYQVLLSGRPAQERETAAFSNRWERCHLVPLSPNFSSFSWNRLSFIQVFNQLQIDHIMLLSTVFAKWSHDPFPGRGLQEFRFRCQLPGAVCFKPPRQTWSRGPYWTIVFPVLHHWLWNSW